MQLLTRTRSHTYISDPTEMLQLQTQGQQQLSKKKKGETNVVGSGTPLACDAHARQVLRRVELFIQRYESLRRAAKLLSRA